MSVRILNALCNTNIGMDPGNRGYGAIRIPVPRRRAGDRPPAVLSALPGLLPFPVPAPVAASAPVPFPVANAAWQALPASQRAPQGVWANIAEFGAGTPRGLLIGAAIHPVPEVRASYRALMPTREAYVSARAAEAQAQREGRLAAYQAQYWAHQRRRREQLQRRLERRNMSNNDIDAG